MENESARARELCARNTCLCAPFEPLPFRATIARASLRHYHAQARGGGENMVGGIRCRAGSRVLFLEVRAGGAEVPRDTRLALRMRGNWSGDAVERCGCVSRGKVEGARGFWNFNVSKLICFCRLGASCWGCSCFETLAFGGCVACREG